MTLIELKQILIRGEDSQHQFKQNISHADSLTTEMVAMANAQGGKIFIGVDDRGKITGLSSDDIRRLNQLVSNVASQSIKPPINPLTENIQTDQGLLIVISVAAGLVYADEVPILDTSKQDLDQSLFQAYYNKRYNQELDEISSRLLENLGLLKSEQLTLTGLLLFGKNPQRFKPAFVVKAIMFPGNDLNVSQYLDSEDIEGTHKEIYKKTFAFVRRNLHHIQKGQSINSVGELEIPPIVIEELLVNALIHRDYFISAPIRLFIFRNRIELISPGHLPNHLTTEQIRYGISNMRNPLLASHGSHILPYRGLGTGIPRVLEYYDNIEMIDDRAVNQFKIIIKRPL